MKKLNYSYALNFLLLIAMIAMVVKMKKNNPELNSSLSPNNQSQNKFVDTTFDKISLGQRTMIYPMPVYVIGSYDENNIPNMMAVAWAGINSSVPARVSISISSQRYSYNNIVNNKAFTINIPSSKYLKEVDYVGNISGRDENKFEATGLTPVKADSVNAPYIKEFPLVLELKVISVEDYGSESHVQIIGEIMDVKADPDYLTTDGNPDISKIDPLIFSYGTQDYHQVGNKIGTAGKEWPKLNQ